jgi:hypothetical protein
VEAFMADFWFLACVVVFFGVSLWMTVALDKL